MSRRVRLVAVPALALTVAAVLVAGVLLAAGTRPGGAPAARGVAAASPSSAAAAPGDPVTRTISVSGEGRAPVKPDLAYVTFGVETSGANLAQAQSDNAARMNAVLDKLKARGIDPKDLQTTGYSVAPQYDRDNKPTGYRVANGVRATVRDLNTLGETIDQVVAAGATRVQGIAFDLAKKDDAIRQAREAAVNDARAKAEQYATLTNVQLGGPVTINEGGATPRTALPAAAPASAGGGAATPPTPIEVGEGTVTVSVQLTYEIR